MTPLEKFYKIVDKFGIASVRKEPAVAGEMAGYAVHGNAEWVGPTCETKDEAIEAAYKELFPLIPASVGVGDEEWKWHRGNKQWASRFHVSAHTKLIACEKRVYSFSELTHGSARLVPAEMRGFLKLIEVDPKLCGPTEE